MSRVSRSRPVRAPGGARATTFVAAAAILLLAPATARSLVYEEAISGDLSEDPLAPTALVLDSGRNTISGMLDGVADTRDYFHFTLPQGQALSALLLIEWSDASLPFPIPGNTGFHALHPGPTSAIPSGATAGDFLGANHVVALPSGTDLLPALASTPIAGTGFTLPLGSGTYTYLVQQTSPNPTRYAFEFVVVPEPSTAISLLLGLSVLAGRRRTPG